MTMQGQVSFYIATMCEHIKIFFKNLNLFFHDHVHKKIETAGCTLPTGQKVMTSKHT